MLARCFGYLRTQVRNLKRKPSQTITSVVVGLDGRGL